MVITLDPYHRFDMLKRKAGGQRDNIQNLREIRQAVWLLQGDLHSDLQ